VIGICCWGVAVEISQTASVTALEPVQDPMQSKDEGLVWRSLSDTVALCQLALSFQTGLDIARPPRVRKGQMSSRIFLVTSGWSMQLMMRPSSFLMVRFPSP
jgi:hypothetical protein